MRFWNYPAGPPYVVANRKSFRGLRDERKTDKRHEQKTERINSGEKGAPLPGLPEAVD